MAKYGIIGSTPAEDYFRGQAKRFGVTLPNQRQSAPIVNNAQTNVPVSIARPQPAQINGPWSVYADQERRKRQRILDEQKKRLAEENKRKQEDIKIRKEFDKESQAYEKDTDSLWKRFWEGAADKLDENSRSENIVGDLFRAIGNIQKLKDIIGNTAGASSNGGIQESEGRITMAKTNKEIADAKQYVEEVRTYNNWRKGIKVRPDGTIDESNAIVDASVDYNQLYKTIKKKSDNYKKLGYTDKDIAELALSYDGGYKRQKDDNTPGLDFVNRSNSREMQKEIDRLRKQQQDDFDYTKTLKQKTQEIQKYKDEQDETIKDEQESLYGDNKWLILPNKMKRKKFWEELYNVNQHAKRMGELGAELSITDPDYWIWGQTAQYGYSVSSGAGIIGQTLSMGGLALSAAAAATGVGSTASGAIYNIAQLAAMPFNYQAGVGENYQEISDKYADNFKNNLNMYFKDGKAMAPVLQDLYNKAIKKAKASGLSDKSAKEFYSLNNDQGINHVLTEYLNGNIKSNDFRLAKAKVGMNKGLKQQFMADNVRTMGNEAIQTAISLIDPTKGTGKLVRQATSRLGKTQLAKKIIQKADGTVVGAAVHSAVNDAVKSAKEFVPESKNFINTFSQTTAGKGAKLGVATSDVLGGGILGRGVGATVGAAAGGAANLAGNGVKAAYNAVKDVMPEKMKLGLNRFTEFAANKYEILGKFVGANKVKRNVLKFIAENPKAAQTAKLLAQYGYRSLKSSIVDHFSEGNEELAQYINSKEDFAKTYGYDCGDLASLVWDDFKIGGDIAKFYGAYFGLGKSELLDDREAVSNWKGGFALGGMHPVMLANMFFSGKGIYDQVNTTQAILTSTIANREADKNTRANNAVLVDQVVKGRYSEAAQTLDQLAARDAKRERKSERFGSEAYWQEKRDNLDLIARLVNSKKLTQQLAAQGLTKGTAQYNAAIADRANLIQQLDDNSKQASERKAILDQLYSSKQYKEQIDQLAESSMPQDPISEAIWRAQFKQDYEKKYVQSKMQQHEQKWKEDKQSTPEDIDNERKQLQQKYEQEAKEKSDDAATKGLEEHRQNIRNAIIQGSSVMNRLKGLLDLKSQMNTIDDWFDFTRNKLGLKTQRPDAKALLDNINSQIKQAKQALSEAYKDFNKDFSDADALQFLNDRSDAIGYDNQEIQDEEKYQAIYRATNSVLNSQLSAMTRDVIQNEDGSYEYNPQEARYNRKQEQIRMNKLLSGQEYHEDKEHKKAQKEDPKNSYSYKRANAIVDAQERNNALDWFLQDVSSGDAISKLTDDYLSQAGKEDKEDIANIEEQLKESRPDFLNEDKVKEKAKENRKKYEGNLARAKQKADEARERARQRKKNYKKWRRGSAFAVPVPFLGVVSDIVFNVGNELLKNAQIGFYKFEHFYNDLKAASQENDNTILAQAKQLYIDRYLNSSRKAKQNLTTPLDVQLYSDGEKNDVRLAQNVIQQDYRDIVKSQQQRCVASSYHVTLAYDEDGNLRAFYNQFGVKQLHERAKKVGLDIKSIISTIKTAKTKEDIQNSVKQCIDKYAIQIDDQQMQSIIDEVSKSINEETLTGLAYFVASNSPEIKSKGIIQASGIRSLVQSIMLGQDAGPYISLLGDPQGIGQVISQVMNLKARMERAGYTVLDTNVPIYGYNDKNQPISSEADLVLVNGDGRILTIDVTESYNPNLKQRINESNYETTYVDRLRNYQTSTAQVLYSMFGSNVDGTFVLPLMYKDDVNKISIDSVFKLDPYEFNRPVVPYYGIENDELHQMAINMQTQLHQKLEQYSQILDQLGETVAYPNVQVVNDGATREEDQTAIQYLENAINGIDQGIHDANDRLQQSKQEQKRAIKVEDIPEESYDHTVPDDILQIKMDLDSACKDLDSQLSQLHDLMITTPEEVTKLDKIISSIYTAQAILNDALRNENSSKVDLVKYEQLIASAIEKLANNADIYQSYPHAFAVKRWWATELANGFESNSIGDIHNYPGGLDNAYYQKIDTWLNAMSDHLLNDLYDDENLQRWYKTIINNYFSKLVDNATNRRLDSGDYMFQQQYYALMQKARDFIQSFNQKFTIDEDPNFDGTQSDIDRINRIPVKWADLYNASTKHYPAFSQIQSDRKYFKMSTSPDFITNGEFSFVEQNGKIYLEAKYKGDTLYIDFEEHGIPLHIDQEYYQRKVKANARFVDKVKQMLEYKKSHPNSEIQFIVSRNKGSIYYSNNPSDPKQLTNVQDSFLFKAMNNQHDLYTITFSQQDRIGVLKTVKTDTGDVNRVFGGSDLTTVIDSFDKDFAKNNLRLKQGTIVYFFNTNHDETNGSYIGTAFVRSHFSPQQSNALASLMYDYCVRGNQSFNGFNTKDMLSMCLYLKDPSKRINPNQDTANMVELLPNLVKIGNEQFQISTQQGYNNLVQKLTTLSNGMDSDLLSSNLNQLADRNNALSSVRQMLMSGQQSVTMPNGMTFTEDDFTHSNNDGSQGSTGLGYFIRNGMLKTGAKGVASSTIYVSDPVLVDTSASDNTAQQVVNNIEQSKQNQKKRVNRLADLFMEASEDEIVDRSEGEIAEFKSQVNSWFEKVFGKKPNWDDQTIKKCTAFASGKTVVGACSQAAAMINSNAPYTTGFHEGFHMLMELVLSPEERNKFYKKYKEKSKKSDLSERDIAEGLADMFVEYMKGSKEYAEGMKISTFKRILNRVGFNIRMFLKYGLGYSNFLSLYHKFNAGKLKVDEISEERSKEFYDRFGIALHYEVKNTLTGAVGKFQHIANSTDKEQMARALGYYVVTSAKADKVFGDPSFIKDLNGYYPNRIPTAIIDKLTGVGEKELTENQMAFREIFGNKKMIDGKVYYPNFDAFAEEIKKYLSSIANAYEGKRKDDEETVDQATDEKALSHNEDKYDKAAFEFSKLDSVSQRVKFFFSTIPYVKFKDDNSGEVEIDTTQNKYGSPTFMPLQQVYNIIEGAFHDVREPKELYNALKDRSMHSPMYKMVFDKFDELWGQMYKRDKDGNPVINYDAESFMVQIFSSIKSLEHNFIIGTSKRVPGMGQVVDIKPANYDRDSAQYPRLWQSFLQSGQSGLIDRLPNKDGSYSVAKEITVNGQKYSTEGLNPFELYSGIFEQLYKGLSNPDASEIKLGSRAYSLNANSGIEAVKNRVLFMLHSLGITISKEALDHMLSENYGGVGREGLSKWILSQGKTSILPFIAALKNTVQFDKIPEESIKEIFNKGFVSQLGTAVGVYNKVTTDKMSIGMGDTKVYNVSQNNSVSNTVDNLNTGDKENGVIKTILQSRYNIMSVGKFRIGSIVAKTIANNQTPDIKTVTINGFRTDSRNDDGSKYSELAETEDYINKYAMLQKGYCLFPTLADKGTYMSLSGIKIPGINFGVDGYGQVTVDNIPTIQVLNPNAKTLDDMFYIQPPMTVINQFIEYAKTERQAIMECMEQLGYTDIPGYDIQGLHILKDNEKIKNYHDKEKGTKFFSLSTLTIPKEDGSVETVSLTEGKPKEMLKRANELFFDKSPEEQAKIVSLTLREQNKLEIQKALSLGVVRLRDGAKGVFGSLQNVNLDGRQINVLSQKLKEQNKSIIDKFGEQNAQQIFNSLAIASMLGDATNRYIISSEECFRLFIGNPQFFKGPEDIQKRIGGLMSTGDDNVTQLPGMKDTYTCAEVKDYEIGSESDIMSVLKQKMIEGELREIYGNKYGFEGIKDISIDQIKEKLTPDVVSRIEKNATSFYESYTSEINVADGASYITADMCKNLLRARGALNKDAVKAFEILEGGDKYSWQKKAQAYKQIYDKVNLVTTKYTAYGFRDHTANGNTCSNLTVPYYNKFAMFPIFDCLATGKMHDIYQKMLKEGVDNLLMTSAIKVGSQGAVKYNGDIIDKPFTTYTQRYESLRRQLNTDPEEGETIAAGTQMIKVGLSNLRLDKEYKWNGTRGNLFSSEAPKIVTGEYIRDTMMNAINKLSKLGVQKFKSKFYNDNGKVDEAKLSKYLIEQLGTRNANQNLIDALTIDPTTGKMKCPIAATTDASWMESMLISAANKDIVDIMTPGSSFIQRSVFAMEGKAKQDSDGKIIGAEIYNGKKLQMINKEGSMDAVISIDFFDDILPKNLSFDEKRQWLIDHNIIGDGARSNTIGYRIPTQAQSSIHSLRFVDVVSATKSTVILPAEFTKITGSDFDIDHLYLMRYNYNEEGNTEFAHDSKEQLQNTIIDCMQTLLKDDDSYNILYKSIDNDTSLVKSIADEIPDSGNTKYLAYNIGTLHEQVTRKNDYITGKIGIGPFALNVTNHILTTLYGIRFKPSSFTEMTGITGFDRILDKDNNQISSWLSAFINAHVDIVKEPYISKLNVNSFTYNMINLLTRNGKGKAGLYFLCQPIIRQMAKISIDTKSKFGMDPIQYKNADDMYKKRFAEQYSTITGSTLNQNSVDSLIDSSKAEDVALRARIVNDVLNNMDMLTTIAKQDPNKPLTEEQKEFQEKVYIAWRSLEKYSNALNNLVQYTKIDTRKQGKNFLEMMSYRDGYNKLVEDRPDNLFDHETIENLVEKTWIDQKTRDAIYEPINIMSGQSYQGTGSFIDAIQLMANDFSVKPGDVQSDLRRNAKAMKVISQAASSCIKVQYAFEFARVMGINVKALFEGNNTIYDRFNSMLFAIEQDAAGLGRLKDNYLIKHLSPKISDDTVNAFTGAKAPKFIKAITTIDENKTSSDAVVEAWEDLLNDPISNVRNLFRDLIVYSMITSGDTKGFNKLAKYIPMSWITSDNTNGQIKTFAQYIEESLKNPQAYIDEDMIAQNNYMNTQLIGRQKFSDFNYYLSSKNTPMVLVKKDAYNSEKDPKYTSIKYDGSRSNNPEDFCLYKYAGKINIDGIERAVYINIPKKGWSEKGGFNIYEYGQIGLSANGRAFDDSVVKDELDKIQKFLKGNISITTKDVDVEKFMTNVIKQSLDGSVDNIAIAQNQQEQQKRINYVSGKSSNGQTVIVSYQNYYKEQPQKHPNVQYVFTDNAQCYYKSHGYNMQGFRNQNPLLNVSMSSACIRTDKNGNITPNAFGLVVKGSYQDQNGKILNQEGCFRQDQSHFNMFSWCVNDMISKIDKTKNIVFPQQIALGRAALPRTFADWLQQRLYDEFNLITVVEPNQSLKYSGFGLRVLGVADEQYKQTHYANGNTVQDIQNQKTDEQLKQIGFSDEDIKDANEIKNYCKGGK